MSATSVPPVPAGATAPRGATFFLQAAYARGYVRVVGFLREPGWFVTDAIFPNLGMCAFVLLYRALGAPKSYEAMAVIGGIMTTYWINVLWGMGAQLYWEKQQGQLPLYFAAPCSFVAILAGMAVGGLAATIARSFVGLAIGVFVFHVRVEAFSPWTLAAVFVVTMTALYALGMSLASLFLLYGREAWHTCNALMEPVFFVSGLYFPVRAFGAVGASLAGLLPLTIGVDALRQVLLGRSAHGLLPVGTEVALLAVAAMVFFALARLGLTHLERLSKREGRLTQRWQ